MFLGDGEADSLSAIPTESHRPVLTAYAMFLGDPYTVKNHSLKNISSKASSGLSLPSAHVLALPCSALKIPTMSPEFGLSLWRTACDSALPASWSMPEP